MSDGALFLVIQKGVRMTGMPAFGKSYPEASIWQAVTFLRRLPHLTPGQLDSLRAAAQDR